MLIEIGLRQIWKLVKLPREQNESSRPREISRGESKIVSQINPWPDNESKNYFPINSFALSLALRQRLGATGGWPIAEFSQIKQHDAN